MKKQLSLSILTAVLLSLSYAPFRTGFLAIAALVPFFFLLETTGRGETFRWSYFTGFLYALGTLYWIGWVTLPGAIGTLIIWPFYIVLYSVLHVRLRQRFSKWAWFALPFLWVTIEYLQSRTELAFPWNHLGYTQSYYLPFIQYAEYTSVLGVSFWLVCLNIVLFHLCRSSKQRRPRIVLFSLLLLLPFLYGILIMTRHRTCPQVQVSLLQGNMDPFQKWADDEEKNLLLYEEMMGAARNNGSDLYVWPETATPFYLRHERAYLARVFALLNTSRAPILLGSVDGDYDKDEKFQYYNTAMLFTHPDSAIQRHAKIKLVPFSEKVPYRDYFPFKEIKKLLYDLIWGIGDYSPGNLYTIFRFKKEDKTVRFAVPICYESAFPDVVRTFCKKGADFLVIITNDAWFGNTSGPYQHARIAVFRAIENRTGIARCANTGISCFIDAYGRTFNATTWNTKTTIQGAVDLRCQTTFYCRYGDVFAYGCAVVSVLFLLVSCMCKKNR
jgi:apolipoprotein N-acyltransferase